MIKFSPKKYFDNFEKYCSLSYLNYLNGSSEFRIKQRELFLNGKIENPVFDYPKLKRAEIKLWRKKLVNLKKEVIGQEENAVLRRACLKKIDSKITETGLLRDILEKNEQTFIKSNFKLYGKPSKKLFNFCLSYFQNKDSITYPSLNKYLDIFEKNTRNEIDDFAKDIQVEKIFNEEKIKRVFNKVIKYAGFNGWKAETNNNSRVGFILDHEKKILVVPQGKTLPEEKLRGLIAHEVGVHLLRRIQGEKLGHPLFYLGLPGYERGEEGLGTLKEMALERKGFNPDHIIVALGICFALGYDNNVKKDFRSVFEGMLKLTILSQDNLSEAEAKNKVWNMCSRIFVVPNWKPEGLCLVRDYIYFDGVLRILDLVGKGKKRCLDLKIGKYDPANEKHIKIARELSLI